MLEQHFDTSSNIKEKKNKVMLSPRTQSVRMKYQLLFLGLYFSDRCANSVHKRYLSNNKYSLFSVCDNDYLGCIPAEAIPETWFQELVFNLGGDTRKHQEESGKARWGKERKPIENVL